jgi:hypothetical protein
MLELDAVALPPSELELGSSVKGQSLLNVPSPGQVE